MVSWRAHDVPVIVIIGWPSVESSTVPLDEEDVPLRDHRVRRAVALDVVVGVEEHAVDGLVATDVDDAQRLAGLHDVRPRRPRPHDLVVDDAGRHREPSRLLLGVEVGPLAPRAWRCGRGRRRPPGLPRHAVTRSGRDRVVGAGVERVRHVDERHEQRQLQPELHSAPGPRVAVEPQGAVGVDADALEEVEVRRDVPPAEPVLGQRHAEVVAPVRGRAVGRAVAVAGLVAAPGAGAAERVVAPRGVVDDGGQHPPHVREEQLALAPR